ncbi:MAG: putative ABC transporter ATP-binding protein YknY [Chlamydiae bacterium]|nr:putative ABC transporter ATP-binding protein YknY [Chlamydiota bacterium]
MLKATHLKKSFFAPTHCDILKDINLEVHPSETVAIMGTSGVGKSTLLHILGTLETCDSGLLEIAHQPLPKNLSKLRNRHIGFIFQSFFLLDHLTVLENILLPAKIARFSISTNSKAYQRALNLLKKLHLMDRKDHLAKTLSGGEKQRTCIARALSNNPNLIFADEPTGNLDQKTSRDIQKLLLSTVKEEGKSLILATHDADFAKKCDKVYLLKDGKLWNLDLSFK